MKIFLLFLLWLPLITLSNQNESGSTYREISEVYNLLISYGIRFIYALMILILGTFIAKMITKGFRRALEKRKVEITIANFLSRLVQALLLIFVVLATLSKLGVQTASLVAILGAMSLAVGLSLKSSLSNLASGLLLVVFRPFKIGDHIRIGSYEGTIDEISLLFTEMVSPDNQQITIPNSKFMSDAIINHSSKEL
ncbi:MAG: hypothetical protein CL816_04725 [Coxiellaceae bacterium]|nr:hypothetical protein [Coxiellaceae bacterium]